MWPEQHLTNLFQEVIMKIWIFWDPPLTFHIDWVVLKPRLLMENHVLGIDNMEKLIIFTVLAASSVGNDFSHLLYVNGQSSQIRCFEL